MFSAITSFIKETTKSQELLKTIDHGDITILIEYGKRIFGALFIKGKQSTEVRSSLKELVTKFEAKYNRAIMYNPGSNSMRDRNYEALVRDGITAAKNGNRRLAWSLLNQISTLES